MVPQPPAVPASQTLWSRRAVLAGIGALSAAACGLVPWSGHDEPPFPKGSTMAHIRDRGVLVVGTKFDQPLFGFKEIETGRLTGFDAEIARLVAAEITGSAANIRFVEAATPNRERFLHEHEVDLILATYSITLKREREVDFSSPYYIANQDVLVRADETAIRTVADLAGRRVCTVTGSTSYDRISGLVPTAQVRALDFYSDCAQALRERRADAVTTDDYILIGLMTRAPGAFRLLNRPFAQERYGIAVAEGDTVLRDYLNRLIRRFLDDGRWDRAYQATLGRVRPRPGSARPPRA